MEKKKNNKKIFIILGIILILIILGCLLFFIKKSHKETNESIQESIIFSDYEMASIKAITDYKTKMKNPNSLEVFEIRVYKKNATDIIIDCNEILENGKGERKLIEYVLEDNGNVTYLINTSKAGQTSSNFGEQMQITIANTIKSQWETDTDYTLIDKEKVLKNLDNENINSTIKVENIDFSKLEQAISNKDLINAVNEHERITKLNKNKEDTEKFAKITNDLQALKDEKKAELLTKVDSSYDDMTQQTSYDFKGFNEYQEKYVKEAFNSGEKVIIQPAIISKEDNINFYMIFTLIKDNWIFFDSMIFNIDGKITNISSSNFDKTTQVIGNGMVGEVAGMYLQKYPMFNALVEQIIRGNEIKIRLVGKDARGNVDFTLTQEDKENFKTLYELSMCLQN